MACQCDAARVFAHAVRTIMRVSTLTEDEAREALAEEYREATRGVEEQTCRN